MTGSERTGTTIEAELAGFVENCRRICERHDRERYLVSLFATPEAQPALFTLLAANHEIAKTAEVVSEPVIGAIRLQWWRESLDGIESGTPRTHEVVLPLARLVAERGVSLQPLRELVDARELDLEPDPPADLEAFMAYAEATGGALHQLMAEVVGADAEIGRAGGRIWAALGLIRAMPQLLQAGRWAVPDVLLEEYSISHQKIKDNRGDPALGSALAPLLDRCRSEIAELAGRRALRHAKARPFRLLTARAADVLRQFEAHGNDPFSPQVGLPPRALVWRHARRALGYRLGL
jgi:phytoene synthase